MSAAHEDPDNKRRTRTPPACEQHEGSQFLSWSNQPLLHRPPIPCEYHVNASMTCIQLLVNDAPLLPRSSRRHAM
eukprot:5097640-Pleurochrysis_carterae.AAC.2